MPPFRPYDHQRESISRCAESNSYFQSYDELNNFPAPKPKINKFAVKSKTTGRLAVLIARQNGICPICENPIELTARPVKGPIGKKAATIDHIIHQSKGGSSSLKNTRAVHQICNLTRADGECSMQQIEMLRKLTK